MDGIVAFLGFPLFWLTLGGRLCLASLLRALMPATTGFPGFLVFLGFWYSQCLRLSVVAGCLLPPVMP